MNEDTSYLEDTDNWYLDDLCYYDGANYIETYTPQWTNTPFLNVYSFPLWISGFNSQRFNTNL